MIYIEMHNYDNAAQNFKVYRLVRLLHNLKVIKEDELIRHEDAVWNTRIGGMDIDLYEYQLFDGNETYQF